MGGSCSVSQVERNEFNVVATACWLALFVLRDLEVTQTRFALEGILEVVVTSVAEIEPL